jgi:cell wall-associated NlpC family hydrolase
MSLRSCLYYFSLMAVLTLSACSTQPPRAPAPPPQAANEILFGALALVGTPYRYGGSSPASGFDCSGLIQYVYRQSAALSLPRTVADMNTLDVPDVDEDELQAGDLLIFSTHRDSRPSHAGIYVGEGRFVHAPSGGGTVRLDELTDTYWQRAYLNAKRPLAAR